MKHLYACSAREILAGNLERAHLICEDAIQLGNGDIGGKRNGLEFSMAEVATLGHTIWTDRGLIRHVAS